MKKREEASPKLEGKFVKNGEIKSKMEILVDTGSRQVKIRNKWPNRKKIANKRFIADLC